MCCIAVNSRAVTNELTAESGIECLTVVVSISSELFCVINALIVSVLGWNFVEVIHQIAVPIEDRPAVGLCEHSLVNSLALYQSIIILSKSVIAS